MTPVWLINKDVNGANQAQLYADARNYLPRSRGEAHSVRNGLLWLDGRDAVSEIAHNWRERGSLRVDLPISSH